MTGREFAMVGCKILGLAFMLIALAEFAKGCITLIGGVASLSQMGQMNALSGQVGCGVFWSMASVVITPVVELCIGLYVWNQADSIAGRITRDSS